MRQQSPGRLEPDSAQGIVEPPHGTFKRSLRKRTICKTLKSAKSHKARRVIQRSKKDTLAAACQPETLRRRSPAKITGSIILQDGFQDRTGLVRVRCQKDPPFGKEILSRLNTPFREGRDRPLGVLAVVAAGANIRCTRLRGERRVWHPNEVIAPRINLHIGLGRHMAADAERALRSPFMMVMLRPVKDRRRVALAAKRIALFLQAQTVRIMTVRTLNTGL